MAVRITGPLRMKWQSSVLSMNMWGLNKTEEPRLFVIDRSMIHAFTIWTCASNSTSSQLTPVCAKEGSRSLVGLKPLRTGSAIGYHTYKLLDRCVYWLVADTEDAKQISYFWRSTTIQDIRLKALGTQSFSGATVHL